MSPVLPPRIHVKTPEWPIDIIMHHIARWDPKMVIFGETRPFQRSSPRKSADELKRFTMCAQNEFLPLIPPQQPHVLDRNLFGHWYDSSRCPDIRHSPLCLNTDVGFQSGVDPPQADQGWGKPRFTSGKISEEKWCRNTVASADRVRYLTALAQKVGRLWSKSYFSHFFARNTGIPRPNKITSLQDHIKSCAYVPVVYFA
jgi:hypothetical protein